MSTGEDGLQSRAFLELLNAAEQRLAVGFRSLPSFTPQPLPEEAMRVLGDTADRLHENYPYAHPLYAGQMLKPPHPVARAAYALAMALNPNNHALDGGRASSAMELEAVAAIASIFGWRPGEFLGHLTSGGTFANLEALWVTGQLVKRGDGLPARIVASSQAHYTHSRISGVLGLRFASIAVDRGNRLDVAALAAELAGGDVDAVVVTLGTTATGAVDPLDGILALRDSLPPDRRFRVHVDAAYGGYFSIASILGSEARAAFDRVSEADSIVIDPHKHGLQPYGCGCVLFRDPAVGRLYRHDSPYTYFTSGDLHLGEISLECSRAGAAAVALWATQRALPMHPGGGFAQGLEASLAAARDLYERLVLEPAFIPPAEKPQLDIVVWAVQAETVEESSARAQAIFDECARRDLHLALVKLPVELFPGASWPGPADAGRARASVTCLRSVLMKPEHRPWMDAIWARLQAATACVLSARQAV